MQAQPRLLLVCTANQCRSPLAEFLLRRAARDRGLGWRVGSAGTHAPMGMPMHPHAQQLLSSRGFEIDGWYTRMVDDGLLDSSDLILTATRQHSSYLLGVRPELRTRMFPLRRFARMVERVRRTGGWSAADDLGTLLNLLRGTGMPGADEEDDLADPVGQPYRRFKACARDIDQAIEQILGAD